MKPPHIRSRDLLNPIGALVFASAAGCALLGTRILLTGHWRQLHLVWNLFLAWLPLLFALAAGWALRDGLPRRWRFSAAALAWLFFFPNAPYILTDLVHLGPKSQGSFWIDLILILLFALTGLVAGFLSLYLMQRLVARRFGWPTGWLFVGAVAALSGFGVYAGRFLRWNSWDVVFNPLDLLADLSHWLISVPTSPRAVIIPALFATLLFIAYTMLYALTRLPAHQPHRTHPIPLPGGEHSAERRSPPGRGMGWVHDLNA